MEVIIAIICNVSCCVGLLYFIDFMWGIDLLGFINLCMKGRVWTVLLLVSLATCLCTYVASWKVILNA